MRSLFGVVSLAALVGACLFLAPAAPQETAAQALPPQALPPRAVRPPAVLADAAFLLEVHSGQALFQKFPDQRRPMASTTKLMTGLLAAESGRLDEVATVSRAAAQIGETTMGLYEGERVSLRDLLYGLMMNSGNDAAVAIAEHLSGSVAAFASTMNARAAALGLTNTRFVNPHGLDHGPYFSANQYASARDLATLGSLALRTPVLAEASGAQLREVSAGPGRPTHRLRHSLSALWWYPGTLGGKTGWTARAGQVRVAGVERGGTRLIAVVMDSPDHVAETRDLLDYGFALAGSADARASVPVGADALPQPDTRLTQAWQSFKRLALTDDGRIRRGTSGDDATADAQAAALLHAVWIRDRSAFDAIWGWTNLALSRRIDHPANPKRMALFASRWSRGNVTDWSNSTAADQRIAAALLQAARLWEEPSYAAEAQRILNEVLDEAAISWDVRGVPASGWSMTAANAFLKELEPATTSGASITPAFYRMFAEAARSTTWLWLLDGAYASLERASSPTGPLGAGAGLLPGWFSVARRDGAVGAPVDPTWQSTGFTAESAALAWQLALDARWNGDNRALRLFTPTARHLARDLAQRGRLAPAYQRDGQPVGGIAAAATAETRHYGALAGIAQLEPAVAAALRAKLDQSLTSNDPDRLLDALDGLWLLVGGPPNFWRVWNPPLDLPTTRNDNAVPPTDGYPWRYFQETGHAVHGPTWEFFNAVGGSEALGLPVTDEFVENGRVVQYFARGRLDMSADRTGHSWTELPEGWLHDQGWSR
ncbi:MAG TPA: glycosyl hydrolase family 8 [Chloroflexota bacterium]|nr:glycosyl hydrolase family 8 [Chloroflexota bacterium]